MPNLLAWERVAEAPKDRLLAVLSGASWDRWTRALLETLDDPGVAEAAKDFTLVRVDADQRPDVARRLSPGGAPTLALLTPDGFPLAASTWAPPRTIREFFSSAAFQWKIRAPLIADELKKAQAAASQMGELRPRAGPVNDEFVRACVEELVETCDPIYGGWGEAPRHLDVAALRILLERRELPGATDALVRTLQGMSRFRKRGEPFSHSYDTPNWEVGDALVLPEEISELCFTFAKAGRILNRPDFDATSKELEPWTKLVQQDERDPRTGFAVIRRNTTAAILRAISSKEMLGLYREALQKRRDTATGLVGHTEFPSEIFLIEDQAALLRITSHLATSFVPWSGLEVGAAVRSKLWDDRASAFRDRFGPPVELAPLDTPQYPVEENAIVAEAMARMGGEWRELAKTCLASFTDAYFGQGTGAARLALAVQEIIS